MPCPIRPGPAPFLVSKGIVKVARARDAAALLMLAVSVFL